MNDKSLKPDLPEQANKAADAPPPAPKRKMTPFYVMVIVFGLPYVLAWYFMSGGDPVSFEAPGNRGQLVSPMIALDHYSLETQTNQTLDSSSLSGKWLLITSTQSCLEACQKTLLIMRQARKAMAVDREAIVPILLLRNENALNETKVDLAAEFSTLHIIKPASSLASGLLEVFSAQNIPLDNSIFMVDPYGNFMMTYPAGSDQLGLLDDMKRLLKVNPVQR